ncbi:hypothetical protein Tco_1154873 [Tanacetum coccineum]
MLGAVFSPVLELKPPSIPCSLHFNVVVEIIKLQFINPGCPRNHCSTTATQMLFLRSDSKCPRIVVSKDSVAIYFDACFLQILLLWLTIKFLHYASMKTEKMSIRFCQENSILRAFSLFLIALAEEKSFGAAEDA